MKRISETIRSINETQRVCTHEISGHLHLLRFCIDEMVERYPNENLLVERCEEAISKLEDLNKLSKICSRYHDRDKFFSIDSITEKAIGLTRLYFHKLLKSIEYKHIGEFEIEPEKGLILIESIYAAASLIAQLAVDEKIDSILLEINSQSNGKILIKAINLKFSAKKARALIIDGNENEKSQRRFTGAYLVSEFNGTFNILESESNFCVEIGL